MPTVHRAPRSAALPAGLTALESVVALSLAHVAADGAVPGVTSLVAFGALVYGAGLVVLRRRLPVRLVLPALLGAQVLGHAWVVALTPAAHHSHGEAGAVLGLGWPMLAAHLLAAVVTGAAWLLRRRAVGVLVRWADTAPLVAPRLQRPLATAGLRVPAAVPTWALAPTRGPPPTHAATA